MGAASSYAEEPRSSDGPVQPEQPEIILPTEVFEIEAFTVETVSAPLPQVSEIRIPVLPVPLPESGELQITEAALAIDPVAPTGTIPAVQGGSSVFSTAQVGFGSRNWLFGDLSVFAFGTEPRLSFEFRHESLDGYGDNDPGKGYFSGSDRIAGSLDFSNELTDLGATVSFDSGRTGFQGEGPFLSLDQRFTRGEAELLQQTEGPLSFSSRIGFSDANRVFTDPAEPRPEQSLDFDVDGRVMLGFDRVELSLGTRYTFDRTVDRTETARQSQSVSGDLSFDVAFDNGLLLDTAAGVAWMPGRGYIVPFTFGIGGTVSDRLSLDFRTGQDVIHANPASLWDSVFAIQTPEETVWGSEWFGSVSATWFARSDTTVSGAGRFSYSRDTYDVGPFTSEGIHEIRQVSERTMVSSNLRAVYSPRPQFRASAELSLNLIERRTIDPLFALGLEAEFLTGNGLSGMIVTMDSPFFLTDTDEVTPVMPDLGITGFYSLTDTIQLSLGVRDLFDLIDRENPRYLYGTDPQNYPLIQPGFRATVSAQLSL